MARKVAPLRLEIKNVKMFNGMDGVGLNATLYFDGKRACEVVDDGSGGETYYRWVGKTREERDAIEKQVNEYVVTLPVKFVVVNVGMNFLLGFPSHERTDIQCPKCHGVVTECEGFTTEDKRVVFAGDLYCKSCDCILEYMGNTLESFITLVTDEMEAEKARKVVESKFKRMCKTQTLFRLPGDSETEYRSLKIPFTPEIKTRILVKYPDLIEIINERY